MPWEVHAAFMREHHAAAGWTFCRYGIRGPTEDGLSFVTGIARAPFGVAWSRFLCVNPDINYRTERSLAALTHTPSGYAIGVFNDMALAVEAAELATRMAIDWQAVSPAVVLRAREAWNAVGIVFAPFLAYPLLEDSVPSGSPPTGIFMRNHQFAYPQPPKESLS